LCKFIVAAFVFLTVFHLLSVWLSTFLEDAWAIWGGLSGFLLLWWISAHVSMPNWLNIFRACSEDNPLLTHRLPWGQTAVAAVMAAAFFLAAKRVVETREY
jgi:hypothetical protein